MFGYEGLQFGRYFARYGSHIDPSPSIAERSLALSPQAIEKLPLVDRISILKYVGDLKEKEKDAVDLARMFRSRNFNALTLNIDLLLTRKRGCTFDSRFLKVVHDLAAWLETL